MVGGRSPNSWGATDVEPDAKYHVSRRAFMLGSFHSFSFLFGLVPSPLCHACHRNSNCLYCLSVMIYTQADSKRALSFLSFHRELLLIYVRFVPRHSSSSQPKKDLVALFRGTLLLELLVVVVAGVGAGHVVAVPRKRCHVRNS